MLLMVHAPLPSTVSSRPEVALTVERPVLMKRIWRGKAADGREFGFELERPLQHGEAFWETPVARYVVRQTPEAVLEVSLAMAASAAAGIGWALGNLHLELQAERDRLLALDEPAGRQLLDRLRVSYTPVNAIFRPGRFARGDLRPHELGTSHQH